MSGYRAFEDVQDRAKVATMDKIEQEGWTLNISRYVLPSAVQKCLEYFTGVDRSLTGYEGLIAAQDCLPTNERRDAFASVFSILSRIWEALSPDPVLSPHEKDYRWLAQVYESLKPSTGMGRLLWQRLGAKTIELIHENVHVDAVRDDLETLVLDAELLEAALRDPDPEKKAKEIAVKLTGRQRKHAGNPKYKALAERLEDLKKRHEQGLLLSIEFLKELLKLAKDVVKTERETPIEEDIDRGKAALTELFEEGRSGYTPVMVRRIVDDIDEIVRAVRFDGWQATHAGEDGPALLGLSGSAQSLKPRVGVRQRQESWTANVHERNSGEFNSSRLRRLTDAFSSRSCVVSHASQIQRMSSASAG